MRAAQIHAFGEADVFRMEEIAAPIPSSKELLVRQVGTSVNHRDIWLRQGLAGETFKLPLPTVLGIDIAGEVVAVGDEVEDFKVGDRVVANPYIVCGHCHACRCQRPHHCADIKMSNGAYAQFALVSENRAVRYSAAIADDTAACFSNTYITAWEMLHGKAHITAEDTVFIWGGTSGLGSAAIEIAQLSGCRVIATAGSEEKQQIVRDRGVEHVIDHYKDDVVATVMELTNGVGASVVLDSVATATIQRSVDMVTPGGRIVCAGLTSGRMLSFDVVSIMMKQFTIVGSTLSTMASARAAVAQLEAGKLHPLIGKRMPLSAISEAHRLMEQGNIIGKILLDVDN